MVEECLILAGLSCLACFFMFIMATRNSLATHQIPGVVHSDVHPTFDTTPVLPEAKSNIEIDTLFITRMLEAGAWPCSFHNQRSRHCVESEMNTEMYTIVQGCCIVLMYASSSLMLTAGM